MLSHSVSYSSFQQNNKLSTVNVMCYVVPAAVTFLRADSRKSYESLWLSWKQAVGEVSSYTLLLYNSDGTQQAEQSLSPDSRSHVFQRLVSGRLYQAVVLTHSGDVTNMATAKGRTGKNMLRIIRNKSFFKYRKTLRFNFNRHATVI